LNDFQNSFTVVVKTHTESWLTCDIPHIAVNLDGYHLNKERQVFWCWCSSIHFR